MTSTMKAYWLLLLLLFLGRNAAAPYKKPPKCRPRVRTAVRRTLHPSYGRGHAYSHDLRLAVMRIEDMGRGNDPLIVALRAAHLLPQKSTVRKWDHRRNTLGHVRRFVRQGNRRATVLRGTNLLLLAYYRVLYPKATAAEINTFLFYSTGRVYSPSQITRAEDRLGLTRK